MLLFSQIFALLCSVFVPAGAAIWIALHYEGKWKIMLLGALTYIIFNIALFLPIVSMVTSFDPVSAWISTHPAAWMLLIALLTVVLAELFRYLVISLFIKYDTTSLDAVSFGLGYGGFQTAMSVGVNVLISIILSSYIAKEGATAALMAEGVGQLCLIVMQIGWTFLIMQAISTKKIQYFFVCVGLEFAVSALSSLGQNLWHWNIWVLLLIMFIFALLAGMYISQEFKIEQKTKSSGK